MLYTMPIYTLIRARKRTLSLQVNRAGELIVRSPLFLPKFLIDQFVESKTNWIKKRLLELKRPVLPQKTYFTPASLQAYIKSEVVKYADSMHLRPGGLRFTQVNSYWGTCSPKGVLSFNLALRFAPPSAVSYVVVHELAHLRWKGHGQRFWDLVKKYYPQTPAMRTLLRRIPPYRTNTMAVGSVRPGPTL